MQTAQQFLTDFVKDIIKHPMERQQLIAGWAKHMEAREQAIASEADLKGSLEAAEQIWGVYTARSRGDPGEKMFDFDKWLPGQIEDWKRQSERFSLPMIAQDPNMPSGIEPFSDERRKLKA